MQTIFSGLAMGAPIRAALSTSWSEPLVTSSRTRAGRSLDQKSASKSPSSSGSPSTRPSGAITAARSLPCSPTRRFLIRFLSLDSFWTSFPARHADAKLPTTLFVGGEQPRLLLRRCLFERVIAGVRWLDHGHE